MGDTTSAGLGYPALADMQAEQGSVPVPVDDEGSPGYQAGRGASSSSALRCDEQFLVAPGDGRGSDPLPAWHAKGARKLVSVMRTSDKYEAFAWLKESCACCFSLASAKWHAP